MSYDKISPKGIIGMATTSDNQYVFVGCDMKLRQYRIADHTLVKEYPLSRSIMSVITSFDSKDVFVGLEDGYIRHYRIDSQAATKTYGMMHPNDIHSMAVTRDNKFLITADVDGLKKISTQNQKVVKKINRPSEREGLAQF